MPRGMEGTTKLFFIDLETTGVKVPESGIVQLAGIIEVDGIEQERFSIHVKPLPDDVLTEEALAVQGCTKEDWFDENRFEPREAFRKLVSIMRKYVDPYDKKDKFFLVAYNAYFDMGQLRAWFEKMDDKYMGSWFWFPPIDVMVVAGAVLMNKRSELSNFKLMTVCEYLGIAPPEGSAHDAMFDVEVTRRMFDELCGGGGE